MQYFSNSQSVHKAIIIKIILTIHQIFFFCCAETFCFIVTLTIYCASPHHPSFLLVWFFLTVRSERKNKCKGFHSNLIKFLRSPLVEVLYLSWKCNYKATTPLPLYQGNLLMKSCYQAWRQKPISTYRKEISNDFPVFCAILLHKLLQFLILDD